MTVLIRNWFKEFLYHVPFRQKTTVLIGRSEKLNLKSHMV